MADQILTLKEVADYLKIAEKTAYRLAADGKAIIVAAGCCLSLNFEPLITLNFIPLKPQYSIETKSVHRYLADQLLDAKTTRSGSNEGANQQLIISR